MSNDRSRAVDLYLKSRCQTAFTYLMVKREEVSLCDPGSPDHHFKTLEVKAALTAYHSTCREAQVDPYKFNTDEGLT